jgi:hypothetical protein
MGPPAPRAVSAVAETARVAPALLLVFRRLLLSATPTTLPLAPSSAAVSQKWIPVIRTAGAALLKLPVQLPATVLPGSSAYRAGTRTSVLWCARRDDSQGSVLTQRDLHRRPLLLGPWVSKGKRGGLGSYIGSPALPLFPLFTNVREEVFSEGYMRDPA